MKTCIRYLFIVQEIIDGVADVPVVFDDEQKANQYYIKIINEVYEQEFDTIEDTLEFMRYERQDFDHDVLYWETSTQK